MDELSRYHRRSSPDDLALVKIAWNVAVIASYPDISRHRRVLEITKGDRENFVNLCRVGTQIFPRERAFTGVHRHNWCDNKVAYIDIEGRKITDNRQMTTIEANLFVGLPQCRIGGVSITFISGSSRKGNLSGMGAAVCRSPDKWN